MLYQDYKAKLDKRKRLFDRLWKYRLLILAGVILLLASVGALLGVKGIVYDFSIPSATQYGQDVSASANCVFGKAQFEYRAVGQEQWTSEYPLYAGTYECRPTGETVAGTKRVGEVKRFEILPREVEVSVVGDALSYGETPEFFAELPYGDVLQVQEYTVEHIGNTFSVTFDAESIVARNTKGEDVTSSYVFSARAKTVAVSRRPLTVQMPSLTVEYDGEAHQTQGAIVSDLGLMDGHVLEVAPSQSYTQAGRYSNTAATLKIVDEEGKDVTDLYAVTCIPGIVEITPRRLTVTTGSLSDIVYDGQPHQADTFEISSQLAEGQQLTVEFGSYTDADRYENIPASFRIQTADGNDVTANYSIVWNYGAVTIDKRPLTVTTDSAEITYDGREHTFDGKQIDGDCAEGQVVRLSDLLRVTNFGSYENRPTVAVYTEDTNRNVTYNYQITLEVGTVTVNKYIICVTTETKTVWYSDAPNISDEYSLKFSADLPQGDRCLCDYGGETMTEVNQAGYINAPQIRFVNAFSVDVSDNYDVETVYGTVTVLPRTLTIETSDASLMYNGEEQQADGFSMSDFDADGNGLVWGHRIEIIGVTKLKECGSVPNEMQFAVVSSDGRDVSANYTLDITCGTLEITPREITVNTQSGYHEYDGSAYSLGSLIVNSIVDGHTYSYDVTSDLPTVTNVGFAENEFTFTLTISDADGNDVTDNYHIAEVNYGGLQVTARSVTLTTGGATTTYNAQPFGVTTPVSGDRLVSGHSVQATFGSYTDADVYENRPQDGWKIVDGNGADVTDNYAVTWNYGRIVINKLAITLSTGGSASDILYDGQKHTAESYAVTSGAFVGGHGIQIANGVLSFYPSFEDAGVHQNAPIDNAWQICDDSGKNVTANYQISWVYGTITILRRPLTVSTGSQSVVYDAQQHFEATYNEQQVYQQLVSGQSFVIEYDYWTNAGSYQNKPLSWKVTKSDGTEVTANYDVTWNYGSVNISRRPLTVKVADGTVWSWVYDGTCHLKYTDFQVAGTAEYPLISNHTVQVNFSQPTEAGSYTSECRITVSRYGVNVTTNYDIRDEASGQPINIAKRVAKITTGSQTWVFESGHGKYSKPTYDPEPRSDDKGLLSSHKLAYFSSTMLDGITDSATEVVYIENRFTNFKITDLEDEDRTANYQIEWEYGKLRVKSAIVVRVFSTKKSYDGKAATLGENDYLIERRPPDVSESDITIKLVGSLTTPGTVTLQQVSEQSGKVSTVAGQEYNRIDFVGQANIIEITRRQITIRTDTIVAVADGNPLRGQGYRISGRGLVSGHQLSATVTGVLLPEQDSAPNTVENIVIIDAQGNDVTQYYDIKVETGRLSWAQ